MPYLPQFENDIYISYAHVDNVPVPSKAEGWIDVFHKYLDVVLSRQIGRLGVIKTWRDVRGDEQFDSIIQNAIEKSAIFLALTSNGYFSSEFCLKELKTFYDAAELTYGLRVGNHSRIFPVHLQDVSRDQWPAEISKLRIPGYRFYDETDPFIRRRLTPSSEVFDRQIRRLSLGIFDTLRLLKGSSPEETPVSQEPQIPTQAVKTTKSAIFISYRRGESTFYAVQLYDRLAEHFGKDRVFMDLDTIEPGDDFVEVITNYVSSCSILIALIHKTWLDAKDDEGRLRLLNPDDFVQLEISTALQRNIRVIPVLVQGASMPRSQDLPDSLSILSGRHALELSDSRWRSDVSKLIKVLQKHL